MGVGGGRRGGRYDGAETPVWEPKKEVVFVSFKLTTNYLINMFQLQPVERRLWTACREGP